MNCRPTLLSWYGAPGLVEGVAVAVEQATCGCACPEPGCSRERLGHEGGEDALLERDLLDDRAEGHDVVGRRQGVGVAQVDLVLAGAALVVAELDRDAHRLEHRDRGPPEVVAGAVRHVVEVARLVDRLGAVARLEPGLEEVELDLGVGVEGEAEVGGPAERALQDVARVGVARASRRAA